MAPLLIHATCIALGGADGPLGVLLRGPSGAGKSDLALRLIDRGGYLVADDRCELRRRDGPHGSALMARAPASIAGKMEVRGLGIFEVPRLPEARVGLLVDLVAAAAVERLPEQGQEEFLGLAVPCIALDPFEVSAPAKLRLALHAGAVSIMPSKTPGPTGIRRAETRVDPGRPADPSTMPQDLQAVPGKSRPTDRGGSGNARRRVVLVTGLSGAGRSTALKALEDIGYEAVDNLPLSLLDAMVGERDLHGAIAVGVDIRTRNFAVRPFLEQLDRLGAKPDLHVILLFLDCDDEALGRRFTETRRRHPLAPDRPVADGIGAERRLVAPLRARAELVVDTSSLNPAELRQVLTGHLGLETTPGMAIFVTSFSYRYGLPREADLVFDVRFLANPHYEAELRDLNGLDPPVARYVAADPGFPAFLDRLTDMLAPLLPRYEQEGKSYLTIAVGCTGGRHRSVAVAEKIAAWLRRLGRQVNLTHRDIGPDRPQRT
ncbi:MAG: RNase adapter RapZ [Kiloniellaceae bacterium]